MYANKITKKLVKKLNENILQMWKQPKTVKPDVYKLYLEMKDSPEWKGKVWHPDSLSVKKPLLA